MKLLKSDRKSAETASRFLKEEKVVILPTDTVYGFSGIVGKTAGKIREIKGRSDEKPFIVLIDSPGHLKEISDDEIPESLLKFWPGPLTVIVKDKKDKSKTVAVRCPGDKWLREVISKTGEAIYSTSVNRSGKPVILKADEILSEFENEVSLVVLDGDSGKSLPSTIVLLESENDAEKKESASNLADEKQDSGNEKPRGFKVVREGVIKL